MKTEIPRVLGIIIDFASLDGKADGVPQFNSYSETRDWEKFVAQNYEDFQRELGRNNGHQGDYGFHDSRNSLPVLRNPFMSEVQNLIRNGLRFMHG